ncbi:hypothetical protein, partial [Helicobacter marmotae]
MSALERSEESFHKATRQSQSSCHSEGGQSPTEESLFDTPEILQVCHSEPPLGGEESLNESLVAHRDSSVVTTPARHDNKSQTSFSSEIYSHHRIKLNRTKCHLLKHPSCGG